MPTVLVRDGYRFYFWSNEGVEPPHIHVSKGDGAAKYWLGPADLAWSERFSPAALRKIRRIITENQELLLDEWARYFRDDR